MSTQNVMNNFGLTKEFRFYLVNGAGFENIRELCHLLSDALRAQGVDIMDRFSSHSSDGTVSTDGKATGVLYLREKEGTPIVKMDVILNRQTIRDDDSFTDHSFSTALVHPCVGQIFGTPWGGNGMPAVCPSKLEYAVVAACNLVAIPSEKRYLTVPV